MKIKSWILLLQELEELVKGKEKDLEKAVERGNALIQHEKGAAFSVVKETLKGLNQSWAHLEHMVSSLDSLTTQCCPNFTYRHSFLFHQICHMKGSLRSVLEQWTLYHQASEEIAGYLMEGRYSVSRLRLLNGSLEAVQQQVEGLEVRKAENILPPLSFPNKTL